MPTSLIKKDGQDFIVARSLDNSYPNLAGSINDVSAKSAPSLQLKDGSLQLNKNFNKESS